MVAQSLDYYSKIKTFLAAIESLVDHWGRSIADNLENGGQDDDKYAGRLFKVS